MQPTNGPWNRFKPLQSTFYLINRLVREFKFENEYKFKGILNGTSKIEKSMYHIIIKLSISLWKVSISSTDTLIYQMVYANI